MRANKHSNSKMGTIIVTVIITVVVIFIILFFLGTFNNKKTPTTASSTSITTTTTTESKSSTASSELETSETSESKEKEKNLTNEEVKEWVQAILKAYGANDIDQPQYVIYKPTFNTDDNLVYVRVEVPQADDYGQFRVNAQGKLEAKGRIVGDSSHWIIISNYYLDTQTATDLFNKQSNQSVIATKKKEDSYYAQIKQAMQKQQDYIDSLTDQNAKQSVQTAYSAGVAEATRLQTIYPDDSDMIESMLNKILDNQ